MKQYRRVLLDPEKYQPLKGGKLEVEIPLPTIIDLWVEWYCSSPVTVSLVFATGLVVPYAVAPSGHFNLKSLNLLSVLFEKDSKALGAAHVAVRDLAVKEQADWTPVEIAPPPALSVQLGSLIDQAVRQQLHAMGVKEDDTIDISEEDNLEEELELDEFGQGYMEDEEPKPKKKKAAPPPPTPVGDSGGSGKGDHTGNVDPGSGPSGSPGP